MAGASLNDIKSRIKSVQSTMQITKAMELVATSKLRRARERVEATRPYRETLREVMRGVVRASRETTLPYGEARPDGKMLYIVIAGDRGLAGGYNANVFRLVASTLSGEDAIYLPIGKKALEYYRHRKMNILSENFAYVSDIGVGEAFEIAELVLSTYKNQQIKGVGIVYTKFVSMISEVATVEALLPLSDRGEEELPDPRFEVCEDDAAEMLDKVILNYIGGAVYSASCEAQASECGARRNAMSSANKNAEEMIDELMLKFNRARQAVITQEITEIVSGAQT